MENNKLMMLMACRHAVVSKIQEGNSEFAHRNDEDEWDTIPYRDVVDWLDDQINILKDTTNGDRIKAAFPDCKD